MKQSIQDLMTQKQEAYMIIKKYIEKHGEIESAAQNDIIDQKNKLLC